MAREKRKQLSGTLFQVAREALVCFTIMITLLPRSALLSLRIGDRGDVCFQRTYGCVVDIAAEVAQTRDGRRVSGAMLELEPTKQVTYSLPSRCKAYAGNEPLAPNLSPIRAFHKPLVLVLIESRPIHMLVEFNVLQHIPLLLHVLEVAAKLFPASISLLEGEVFPQLFVKELIDGRVGVDAGARVAVPVPDPARGGAFFEDFDGHALLADSVMALEMSG